MANVLDVADLSTGYANKVILRGVGIHVAAGETVALLGHNGAGKSTFLKAVFGLLPLWSGKVLVNGINCHGRKPRDFLSAGVRYIPQADVVFTELSVRENLEIAGRSLSGNLRSEGINASLEMFPALKNRQFDSAGNLSGGERQMVALARAIIGSPQLVLLDEPTIGLSPALATEFFARIQEMSHNFGTAFLIVEQKLRQVLKAANRAYVLRHGSVSYDGDSEQLLDEAILRQVYL